MSEKIINIAIVWANPYNKNLGVAALAYSALSILNDVADENNISATFTFFGSDKTKNDSLCINNKTLQFDNVPGMNFFSFKHIIKFIFFPSKARTNKIISFDYIFDIGEGDSFTDIYGQDRFNKILNSKKFFHLLGKPQVLLPQTIGPFKSIENEKAAFQIMPKLNKVISRDHQSYNYSSKFLDPNKIDETIDVAFYMPFQKTNQDNGKINVGINVSGLLWNGGYTKNNQFGMKTDYKQLILDTLSFFSAIDNVQVHLVSHVIHKDQPIEDDYLAAEEINQQFPNMLLAPRFKNPIEAKSYISSLDFFTGARMHACIAAFSTGVPVFPMAYSRKFNGLFSDTLEYSHLGDCVNESNEIVLQSLKQAFYNRSSLKETIRITDNKIIQPRIKLLKNILAIALKN